MKEKIEFKNKKVLSENVKFSIMENEEGQKNYYLETTILPFNKKSRNKRLYNEQSAKETHNMLVGNYLLFNHISDGAWDESKPRGEWIETQVTKNGIVGKAKIYNTSYNKELIEFLQEASNVKVSLNVDGYVNYKTEENTEESYQEVVITDWYETSLVAVPGFVDASTSTVYVENFVEESLKNKIKVNKDEPESSGIMQKVLDLVTLYNIGKRILTHKK